MEITESLIDHLSKLARLSFEGEEKEKIKNDLNRIVGFMDTLNELDTDGYEPLIYMNQEVNRLREDEITTTLEKDEILKNAPKKDSDYFRIPKVRGKHSA
ncbi:MAG: Asp-tRNA(Asn)/Glu-tRNA(Gln) amidotransferase subunit GatC [Flavobacteriales bacterium]|jgi:aspartyl-tRNA(Asn)/glutamyl-tRNA(Gln) amidotransferase subunit C